MGREREDNPAAYAALSAPRPNVTRSSPRVGIIGIGVQKAATSWLFQCLRSHPGLRAATRAEPRRSAATDWNAKELHFFSHHWEKGYAWYEGFFEEGRWKNLEFSTTYFHNRNVPGRLREYNPNVRLLLSFRNPVDRALSQHRHDIAQSWLPSELYDFRKAVESNPSYVEQGRYGTHLAHWLRFFDRQQLCVVDYEDILSQPARVMKKVYEFVGVASDFQPPELGERVYVSRKARHDQLHRLMHSWWNALGEPLRRILRTTGVPRTLRETNEAAVGERWIPPLSDEERQEFARLFTDENLLLGSLLGRDYSHWR